MMLGWQAADGPSRACPCGPGRQTWRRRADYLELSSSQLEKRIVDVWMGREVLPRGTCTYSASSADQLCSRVPRGVGAYGSEGTYLVIDDLTCRDVQLTTY